MYYPIINRIFFQFGNLHKYFINFNRIYRYRVISGPSVSCTFVRTGFVLGVDTISRWRDLKRLERSEKVVSSGHRMTQINYILLTVILHNIFEIAKVIQYPISQTAPLFSLRSPKISF